MKLSEFLERFEKLAKRRKFTRTGSGLIRTNDYACKCPIERIARVKSGDYDTGADKLGLSQKTRQNIILAADDAIQLTGIQRLIRRRMIAAITVAEARKANR